MPSREDRLASAASLQGVGFRPFIYNLAQRLGLWGYVLNSSIKVEGESVELDRFVSRLARPALRRVSARYPPNEGDCARADGDCECRTLAYARG